MPEQTGYARGMPCWADIGSPDIGVCSRFYGGLFGWDIRPDEDSAYSIAYLHGRAVAGMCPAAAEGRPWWTTYVAVRDADAAVKIAVDEGASLLSGPADAFVRGRTALLADPAGAVFAVWQAGVFPGAELVNEPGALCWNELAVRDVPGATGFYGALFGWESRTSPFGGTSSYTEFFVGDQVVAGMVQMNEVWPPEIPAHWMVYFTVADCDAAAARVAELGGVVSIPPFDTGAGRVAVVDDPHGAVFSVIELT
jgi:predicted enzyme related to lactoylglutathione lyase